MGKPVTVIPKSQAKSTGTLLSHLITIPARHSPH